MAEAKKAESKLTFMQQITGMAPNFWVACFMEILERLAFFGSRAVAPLYLVAKTSENGLGLSYSEKGVIYTVWALLQCLIPMVSGGYTERYGYRKSLCVAFALNIVGYLGMAQSRTLSLYLDNAGWTDSGFWVFLLAACFVATGTAIFKPPAHGTIAKATTEETSSMGWGIFYWVVNIGGALAPMAAAQLRGEFDWDKVFYGAAIVTACIYIPAFLLYREPEKDLPKGGEEEAKGPLGVFTHSIMTILSDLRLVVFLGIFSCFWLMFMQLWDLLPNFVDEWVNSTDVAGAFGAISQNWLLGDGNVKPEMIINIDSIAIILLVIPISAVIGRINKVAAMIIGMLISLVGFVLAGSTMLGWICCLAVFIFAIGEMACSPTFSAYIGVIAPKDKKALYMGYSNIPFAIGWAAGGLIGGLVYEACGAKSNLAMDYLAGEPQMVAEAAQAADWSHNLEKIPPLLGIERSDALGLVQTDVGLTPEATASMLKRHFRYDEGQAQNLALIYLGQHGAKKVDKPDLAAIVHELPEKVGVSLDTALDAVADLVNEGADEGQRKQASDVVALLWETYGDQPGVVNNLALEYLAQSTPRLKSAVAELDYRSTANDVKARVAEIGERIGLTKDQAFGVLATVLADPDKMDQAPAASGNTIDQRYFVQLVGVDKHRYSAVSKRNWSKDVDFLKQLVEGDSAALSVVTDNQGGGSVDYKALAENRGLIREAIKARDWSASPELAAQLLALNPAEARAVLIAAEAEATQILWDKYHPYMVWYYLGLIGLAGTIGMILFYFATKKPAAEEA